MDEEGSLWVQVREPSTTRIRVGIVSNIIKCSKIRCNNNGSTVHPCISHSNNNRKEFQGADTGRLNNHLDRIDS